MRKAVESRNGIDTLKDVATLEMVLDAIDSLGTIPPEVKLTRREEVTGDPLLDAATLSRSHCFSRFP